MAHLRLLSSNRSAFALAGLTLLLLSILAIIVWRLFKTGYGLRE